MAAGKRLIVKVQVPLFSSGPIGGGPQHIVAKTPGVPDSPMPEGAPPALIYNQDRSLRTYAPVDPQLLEAMGGQPKKFFYAEIRNQMVTLQEEAPWQAW